MDYAKFQRRTWSKKRWAYGVGMVLVTLHCVSCFVPIIAMYEAEKAGFGWIGLTAGFVAFFVNLVLCVRAQWYMRMWEMMLDGYERRHGLNTEYHEFVDDMKRQGKWPRTY